MLQESVLNATQAAELLGYTAQHVRLLARSGRIRAFKTGREWLFDRQSILDLQARLTTPRLIPEASRGRPPKGRSDGFPPQRNHNEKEVAKPLAIPNLATGHAQLTLDPASTQIRLLDSESTNPEIPHYVNGDGRTEEHPHDPRNKLNDLTATEWLPETVSVWVQKGLGASHPEAKIEREHPAPFSFTDIARLIRFFTKPGATILDPFVGVGSTLKACALNQRNGIGIELSPRYVELARRRLLEEVPHEAGRLTEQQVLCGDARDLVLQLEQDTVDFVVTSPPYASILHKADHKARQERIARGLDTRYSDDARDFGNIRDYAEFLRQVARILVACARPLKPKKYMAIIVSDFRDGPAYYMYHADLARELGAERLNLRGITILYQRHKRVFPYGYPFAYVPNIHHQYVLILQNDKR